MKTSEQTKRAVSVGFITAARVVIVAAATLFCGVTAARADEPDNRIDWRWGRPGVMVVTNAPTAVTVTNIATTVATDVAGGVAENLFGPRVTALEGGTNNWNTAYGWGDHAGLYKASDWVPSWGDLTDIPQDFPPSTHEHDYTTITNPPWLTSFTETDEIALSRVTVLEGKTNNWNAAFGWGDHAGLYKGIGWFPSWTEVTDKPATFPPETHQHDYTAVTNPPWLTEYTESDPVAMAALAGYQSAAYWPPNATARDFFTFTTNANEITITGYNIAGGTDVIIPDYINGWPVTTIGANAFAESGVTSIGGAGNVVTVGDSAFEGCTSLASVSLPQVQVVKPLAFTYCYALASVPLPQAQTVGDYAFVSCTSLTSLYFDNDAPTIGANILAGIPPNQVTNYVTNPQATGWGETLGGMPVVRLPLYTDAIYQAGELVATTGHVAQAIAAIPEPDLSDHPTFSQIAASNALPYTAWTGTVTPANGTATVAIAHGNMPVLVADAPCVLTLDPTGYGTAGVSRVSLSYYPGTNSFTFATNIINYAETPTVDTNGWNTLLIRRVSDGAWKGVGL